MSTHTSSLSVIIPVYNDPHGIRDTLESFLTTVFEPGDADGVELIVVDNGSSDHTREVVRKYCDEHESITLAVEADVQGSYAARNCGIRHATGEVFAFLDADMTVSAGWLSGVREALESTGADYLGCDVALQAPPNPSLAARYDRHTGFPIEQYVTRQGFAPTCCLVVRRSVFENVGLFDPRLASGGDKEFGNRVRAAGYDLAYTDAVTLTHPTRNSIRALVSKDLRVGRGLCQLQRYHPERYGTPGRPPRPSGIKSPTPTLPTRDRLTFGALSTALTGIRGLGYYREYATGEKRTALAIPSLE